MRRIALASIAARKRRMASTSVAVVLGVAFFVGALVLGDTVVANFDELFDSTRAGTDVVVRNETAVSDSGGPDAERGVIDAALVEDVAGIEGVAGAAAEVDGYGQLIGADGEPIGGNGPPRNAGSWVTNPELNPYQLVAGRAPEAADEVVINRGAAETGELAVGDRTVVQTPDPVDVTVVGIATFGDDADGMGETTYTAFGLEAAQTNVLGSTDVVSSIVVEGAEGIGTDALTERVDAAMPAGVEAITGQELADEEAVTADVGGGFRGILLGFAGIALVVAVLSVQNTFTITVSQRTRELALLRAVGASRRQVRRVVRLEALAIGVVASAVGVLAGLAVAQLLKGLLDSFGFGLPTGGLVIQRSAVVLGMLVGTVATLVAARGATRRAARVSPISALREASAAPTALGRGRIVAGIALGVVGIAALVTGMTGAASIEGLGAVLLLAGTLTLAPVAVPPVARAVGAALAATRGLPGRLARDNSLRNPRRTASTATALVVGVAVVSLFTVFASSLSSSIDDEVTAGLGDADLALTAPVFGGGELSPEAATAVAEVPAVGAAVPIGGGDVRIGEESSGVTVSDLAIVEEVLDMRLVDGGLDDLDGTAIAVSEERAEDEGWTAGSTVETTFADGATETLTVSAVYEANEVLGAMVVDRALWERHVPQPTDRAVFMTTAPDADVGAVRDAVAPLADEFGGEVQDRDEYAAANASGVQMLLGVAYALLVLAIVIALLGIANTLSLAVHERRSEIGLLRAVGQTRRHARATVRLESVIVSVFGTVVGLVLGSILGWALFVATSGGDPATVPVVQLVVVAVLGALAGVLAAIRPARRAARLPVLEAIAPT